jgi:hypothetical protein
MVNCGWYPEIVLLPEELEACGTTAEVVKNEILANCYRHLPCRVWRCEWTSPCYPGVRHASHLCTSVD